MHLLRFMDGMTEAVVELEQRDIAPETLTTLRVVARTFLEMCKDKDIPLDFYKNHMSAFGMDFWLTNQGHGSGYWDGDYPEHGELLTQMTMLFPMLEMYAGDDDLLYIMA